MRTISSSQYTNTRHTSVDIFVLSRPQPSIATVHLVHLIQGRLTVKWPPTLKPRQHYLDCEFTRMLLRSTATIAFYYSHSA